MATSSESSAGKEIDGIFEFTCTVEERNKEAAPMDSMQLTGANTEDSEKSEKKSALLDITGVSCAINEVEPGDLLLESTDKKNCVIDQIENNSVNSALEIVQSEVLTFTSNGKNDNDVCNVENSVANCAISPNFQEPQIIKESGKSEIMETACESKSLHSSAVVPSIEDCVDKSIVKKTKKKKKLKTSSNIPNVSMADMSREPINREPSTSFSSAFSVQKLNEIFNSWTISDFQPGNQTFFASNTTRCESLMKNRRGAHESAIPEEYLPNPFSKSSRKPEAKAAIKEKKNKTKSKKKKAEVSVDEALGNSRFSKFGNHVKSFQDSCSDLNRHCNDSSGRSKSADGKIIREVIKPQSGSSLQQGAMSLDQLSQLSVYQLGHCSDVYGHYVESKVSKTEKKTKKNIFKGDNSRITKYDELAAVQRIADKIINNVTQSSGKKVKKNKKDVLINTDAPNSSVPSSPNQKNQPKSPNKKSKRAFDEYMPLEAVKEGMKNATIIESVIRINPKNYTEAYATSPNGGQDILIEGIVDRNRALEGDLVAILIKDRSEWKCRKHTKKHNESISESQETNEGEEDEVDEQGVQETSVTSKDPQITGKVVSILSEQHSRKCVGYLKLMKDNNDKYALFSPRDNRIPRLHIPREKCPVEFWQNPTSKKETLFLAKIKKWMHGMFALGEIVEEVGESADPNVETTALLMDNDLDVTPYPEAFSKMFLALPNVVSEEEISKRLDLRKECIFTIDPMTAKDLDDAVSCKELENGNLEIGVHISDVTYFLQEGTPLDDEVSKRATSVYLVDKVHHMLPVELCLQCSLLPGQDKLAYSVIWEITKDAKIISQRITRSVIQSCVKLAYEHAQVMLENPEKDWKPEDFPPITNGYTISQISKVVHRLQNIAVRLRGQRFEDGALRIDQTKIMVHLDSKGIPMAVEEYINQESHRLIEEFMLLANMSTAKFIYDNYPDIAFLRCHPEPHKWPLELLQEALATRGIHLNITSAGALQTSLARYAGDDFLSKTRLMVLNVLCAKTMARAKYFCSGEYNESDFWHYALSVPFYTHFTSPIRRYADVMVHRLLNAALGYCPKPMWTQNQVANIAANCNKKKYAAKMAGEQSIKLYLSIYVRCHQPVVEDAVVIHVKDHSFDVNVCKFGISMRVYVSKLNVELDYDSKEKVSAMKIKWNATEDNPVPIIQVIELFTVVTVKITTDDKTLKMESRLLRPSNSPVTIDNSLLLEENI